MDIRKILVLGCGRVGLSIANDLQKDFDVCVIDNDRDRLNMFGGPTICGDILSELPMVAPYYDLVVSALPGSVGYRAAELVVGLRKHLVDISYFSEDQEKLKEMAKEHNLFVALDCGIAPGFSNMILGHFEKDNEVDDYVCHVGGLPKDRKLPYEYKAGYHPFDMLSFYTRPARYMKDGHVAEIAAMTEVENLHFPGIGTLESFNTDGARTMLQNCKTKNFKEKTIRYPGHSKLMAIFRDSGFFDTNPISVRDENGNVVKVSPLEMTAKLLFKEWKFEPGDEDFTVMRAVIKLQNSETTMDLHCKCNSEETSMAISTSSVCNAVVRAFKEDVLPVGFYTPEQIGELCFSYIEKELVRKGISIKWRENK